MHDYRSRRNRLRKNLHLAKLDAFLVTNLTNVSYLTGFTGSSAWLIVSASGETLISDSRYATQLAQECPDIRCEIRDAKTTQLHTLAQVIQSSKFKSLKYEAESLTKAAFDQLVSTLEKTELVSTTKEIEQLRAIKDKTEIAAIRKSISVNQAALNVVRAQFRGGQTEREIAHNLEHQMRLFGAKGVAFEPSVAVGPRSALPHARPSYRQLDSDAFFLIDWGATVDRYASDLTRVFVSGKIPPKLRKIYDTVLAAQQAAIDMVRPGVAFNAVDAAARSVIESAGYGKNFGHGTGHGFGLEIHEHPYLSPIHEEKLVAGMVVTIEPGIYLPDWGGVRIEDDVLVTQNGCEVLSDSPKELEQCVVQLR